MNIVIPVWILWFAFVSSVLALIGWWAWGAVSNLRENHLLQMEGIKSTHQLEISGLELDLAFAKAQLAALSTLWLVGRHVRGNHWDVQGIFASREEAMAACKNVRYFLFPLDLGVSLPEESTTPFKLEYPKEAE